MDCEMEFSYPRQTYNPRLSKNEYSSVELLTDNPIMLSDLLKTPKRKKEFEKVVADYKAARGFKDFLMVKFRQIDGEPVSSKIDGAPKEFRAIVVEEKNDVPAVMVTVRLV